MCNYTETCHNRPTSLNDVWDCRSEFILFRDTPLVTVFCGPVAEEIQIFCFSESQAESLDEAGWRNLVFCFGLLF